MDRIADALVEAVMFIAYRDYADDASVEDFEDADIEALDGVKTLLAGATEEERKLLHFAVERAMRRLPPDSDMTTYYRAWMTNMFEGEETAKQ